MLKDLITILLPNIDKQEKTRASHQNINSRKMVNCTLSPLFIQSRIPDENNKKKNFFACLMFIKQLNLVPQTQKKLLFYNDILRLCRL